MIYVNPNADYSASAIGMVEIPVVLESETQAILAKYTKTISKAEQQSLNSIVLFLKSNGLYSKLSFLALPCLAGSIPEALTNIITNEASDYDATVHDNVSLETYGIKVAVKGDTTAMPYTPFVDTLNKTMLINWYQQTGANNVIIAIGQDYYSGANQYIIAPYVTGAKTYNSFPVGFNTEIMECAGTTYTASNFSRYVNGVADTINVQASKEGTNLSTTNKVYIGCGKKADANQFCSFNAQVSVVLIFNEAISSSLIEGLNDAISSFDAILAEVNA